MRGTRWYSGNNEFIFTMDNGERIVSGRSYKGAHREGAGGAGGLGATGHSPLPPADRFMRSIRPYEGAYFSLYQATPSYCTASNLFSSAQFRR